MKQRLGNIVYLKLKREAAVRWPMLITHRERGEDFLVSLKDCLLKNTHFSRNLPHTLNDHPLSVVYLLRGF